MNQALIKDRKLNLVARKEQSLLAMKNLLAQIKTLDGAISECDFWLSFIDKQETHNLVNRLKDAVEKTGQTELTEITR